MVPFIRKDHLHFHKTFAIGRAITYHYHCLQVMQTKQQIWNVMKIRLNYHLNMSFEDVKQ